MSTEDLIDSEPPTIDPYEVLGLERDATPDLIKSTYRKAALKHHPGTDLAIRYHPHGSVSVYPIDLMLTSALPL
jgi:DnaJ-domain-containing protein 1